MKGRTNMRPHAVLEVRPDKVARVCAWCPDKVAADEWCEGRGYEVSHGMCDACKEKQRALIPAINAKPKQGYYDEEIKRLEEKEKTDALAKAREGRGDGWKCDERSESTRGENERREGRSPSVESLSDLSGNA